MGVGDVEVRRVFVDTAWNRKPHACYDPLTDRFFEARKLTDLKDYDEIYLDSLLFPGIWSELRDLIADGRRVYHFTRPWKWRGLRKRFSDGLKERLKAKDVKKSDFEDAYILWKVYEVGVTKGNLHKWFKRVTMIDVKLRPLLTKEAMIARMVDRLERMKMVGIQVDEVEKVKELLQRIRREIVDRGFKLMPWIREVAKRMGLDGEDMYALTGLMGLAVYLKRLSYHQAIRYLGLYKARRRGAKRCSGRVRRYLVMLATSIVRREGRFPPRFKDLRATFRKLTNLMRELEPAGGLGGAKAMVTPRLQLFVALAGSHA